MTKAELRKKIQESKLSKEEKGKLFIELDKSPFPNQSFLTKVSGLKSAPAPKKAEKKEEKKETKPLSVGDNKKQPVADGK